MATADHAEPGRWLPFWAATAAALALRLLALGDRPLSHDEAVNAAFLARLAEGLPYTYNPASFHGPLLYFAGWGPLRLLGTSDAALRLPVALVSAGMIPLLLPLRSRLGVAGVTGAAWLLALSPSLVFTGRTLIHETWLVFFTLALAAFAWRWLETRRDGDLVLACASLGLMLTVKETAVLTLAGLLGAAVLAWAVAGCPRPFPGEAPRLRTLLAAGASLALPPVLLFTSFLAHPRGLLDALRAPFLWSEVGISGAGHAKPWTYFLRLLAELEPAVLLGAALGGWLAVRRRDPFGMFCAAWTAGQLLAYSAIPYKTPWLALNIVLPAALTAGFAVREAAAWRPRKLLLALGLLALGWSGWRAAETSLLRYDDRRMVLSYAHSRREVRGLVTAVRAAAQRAPAGRAVTTHVMVRHPWPLPWYLRGLPGVRWWREVPPHPDGGVLVVDTRWEKVLRPRLRKRYVRSVHPFRAGLTLAMYRQVPSESAAEASEAAPEP